jgi:hypothetical protein
MLVRSVKSSLEQVYRLLLRGNQCILSRELSLEVLEARVREDAVCDDVVSDSGRELISPGKGAG